MQPIARFNVSLIRTAFESVVYANYMQAIYSDQYCKHRMPIFRPFSCSDSIEHPPEKQYKENDTSHDRKRH
eukprot:scaffold123177_cov20-Prasinocladus_malaysianus.AAC.1